jgi:hypothetical protein
MNNSQPKNFIWGIFWIIVGLIVLAFNLDWIHFSWFAFDSLLTLWPLLLVALGLLYIFNRQNTAAITITLLLLVVALPLYLVRRQVNKIEDKVERFGDNFDNNWEYNADDDEDDDSADTSKVSGKSQVFTAGLEKNTQTAELELKAGAGKFEIEGTTDELFKGTAQSDFARYALKSSTEGNTAKLTFSMKGSSKHKDGGHIDFDKNHQNEAKIALNTKPEWNLDINLGAGKGSFDLSQYKIKDLEINTGAAAVDVKLGATVEKTKVDIKVGVGEINVEVPESVGCRIEGDTFLADTKFVGFVDRDGYHETSNYEKASKKIVIKIEGAMASIKVKRY